VSELAAWIGAGVGLLAILAAPSRIALIAWRANRRLGRFLDDWFGDVEVGRQSMPARVGRLEGRIVRIERHVFQIRDQVVPPEA
jgi:hypothetical protein